MMITAKKTLPFLLFLCGLYWLIVPSATQAETPKAYTFLDRGYTTTTVRGLFPISDYFFPGPGPYKITGPAHLKLHYSYTDVLQSKRASFSVRVNEQDVLSTPLNPGGAKSIWLDVYLPENLLKPDLNKVQFAFYMPYDDDKLCTDPNDPMHWATIFEDSSLEYNTGGVVHYSGELNLNQYPKMFLRDELGPEPEVNLLLPQNPDSTSLTGVASLVTYLSQAGGSRTLKPVLLSPDDEPAGIAIAVGQGSEFKWLANRQGLPLAYNSTTKQFVDKAGNAIPPETGVIELINGTKGEPLLLVSGGSAEGVRRATLALVSRSFSGALSGQYALINTPPDISELNDANSQNGAISFGKLSGNNADITLRGFGRHSSTFRFFAPEFLNQGNTPPRISVHFSHSAGLHPDSLLTLEVNGIAVGSASLNEANANGGTLNVNLPLSVLKAGGNDLVVAFELRYQNYNICTNSYDTNSWATLYQDSSLETTFSAGTGEADLVELPAPFIRNGVITQTAMVLPTTPTREVISQALDISVRLGQYTRSDLTYLPVKLASGNDASAQALAELCRVEDPAANGSTATAQCNLIILGIPAEQPLVGSLLSSLPVKFDKDGLLVWQSTTKKENAQISGILAVQNQQPVGVLQLVNSPWATGRQILLVSGTTSKATGWSVKAINSGTLQGKAALVTGEKKVTSLPLSSEQKVTKASEQKPAFLLAAVAGLGTLVLLVFTGFQAGKKLKPEGEDYDL